MRAFRAGFNANMPIIIVIVTMNAMYCRAALLFSFDSEMVCGFVHFVVAMCLMVCGSRIFLGVNLARNARTVFP